MIKIKLEGDFTYFYENDKLILTMEETETDDGILMTLKGELKSETAHSILDELNAYSVVGMKVTVDFAEVTFVSSAVLNALLDAQQMIDQLRKGELILRRVPDAIYTVMDENRVAELLMIED